MASIGSIARSGMEASMIDLEEISNNIANANTVGFKKSLVNYSDIQSRALGETRSNGLGVKVQSIIQDFSPGNIESTNRALDISISNDGFFILKDPSTNQDSYTRAGRFELDKDGYILGPSGRVQGYGAQNGVVINSGGLNAMQVPNTPIPANATTAVSFDVNLDSSAPLPSIGTFDATNVNSYNYRADSTIFDSLGNEHSMTSYYVKSATANEWQTYAYVDGVAVDGPDTLVFNTSGTLTSPASGTIATPSFTPSGGGSAMTLTVDYKGSTQFGSENKIRDRSQNGNADGEVVGFTLDNDGKLDVFYSNGQSQILGQIALARFKSPQNLGKSSNMSWISTAASGEPVFDTSASNGAFNVGAVEVANVDLTDELVKLIGAQHNFHANTQVQQTYNQILQTIENIR